MKPLTRGWTRRRFWPRRHIFRVPFRSPPRHRNRQRPSSSAAGLPLSPPEAEKQHQPSPQVSVRSRMSQQVPGFLCRHVPAAGGRLGANNLSCFCTAGSSHPKGQLQSVHGAELREVVTQRFAAPVQTETAEVIQRGAVTFRGCAGSCLSTERRGLWWSASPRGDGRFARCRGPALLRRWRWPRLPSLSEGGGLPWCPQAAARTAEVAGDCPSAVRAMAAGKPQPLPGHGGPCEAWRLPAEGRCAPDRYLRWAPRPTGAVCAAPTVLLRVGGRRWKSPGCAVLCASGAGRERSWVERLRITRRAVCTWHWLQLEIACS